MFKIVLNSLDRGGGTSSEAIHPAAAGEAQTDTCRRSGTGSASVIADASNMRLRQSPSSRGQSGINVHSAHCREGIVEER
jgi:hypothetical protein